LRPLTPELLAETRVAARREHVVVSEVLLCLAQSVLHCRILLAVGSRLTVQISPRLCVLLCPCAAQRAAAIRARPNAEANASRLLERVVVHEHVLQQRRRRVRVLSLLSRKLRDRRLEIQRMRHRDEQARLQLRVEQRCGAGRHGLAPRRDGKQLVDHVGGAHLPDAQLGVELAALGVLLQPSENYLVLRSSRLSCLHSSRSQRGFERLALAHVLQQRRGDQASARLLRQLAYQAE